MKTKRKHYALTLGLVGAVILIYIVSYTILKKGHQHTSTDQMRFNGQEFPWMNSAVLPRKLNKIQYERSIRLVGTLSLLFWKANITFAMNVGTLLGSYVCHDLLPWDDDIDLMVSYADLPRVKRIFRKPDIWRTYAVSSWLGRENEYSYGVLRSYPENASDAVYYNFSKTAVSFNTHEFRFFYKEKSKSVHSPRTSSFVDIRFYTENDTHIWKLHSAETVFPKSSFYPLHLRQFSTLQLPSPKDPLVFLVQWYGHLKCPSLGIQNGNKLIHFGNRIPEVSYKITKKSDEGNCQLLTLYYPFVWREKSDKGVIEILRLRGKDIHRTETSEEFVLHNPFQV